MIEVIILLTILLGLPFSAFMIFVFQDLLKKHGKIINRKKMETEKWAIRNYELLLKENEEIEHRIKFDTPTFRGYERSRYLQNINHKNLEKNERKLRQVELILKKIGYDYE